MTILGIIILVILTIGTLARTLSNEKELRINNEPSAKFIGLLINGSIAVYVILTLFYINKI